MAKKSSRHSTSGKALILGALLTVALPGIAYATTTVTVRTPGYTTAAPNSANSVDVSTANCRTGGDANDLVSGVGIDQTIGTGTPSQSNLHVTGVAPYNSSTGEYIAANGFTTPGTIDTDATKSVAVGGTGGSMGGIDAAFGSAPFAVCLDPGTITTTDIVMAVTSGSASPGTFYAMATCPENTRLLGGGARTTPDNQGNLKPIMSFPTYNDGTGMGTHDNGKIAAGNNATNPDSWTAVALTSSGSTNNKIYSYAICGGITTTTSAVSRSR